MTVRCPRCDTLYRRPPGRRGADVSFRCARCRHVFEVEAEEPALAGPGADDDDEARFSFDDEPEPQADEPDEPEVDEPDEPEVDEPELDEPEASAPRLPASPPAAPAGRGVTPARFALRSLLGVTLAYAVLSVYLYTHPEAARDALARVPLVGPGLAETRLSPASIQLTNVQGGYQRVKGDRLVFVISGTAVNNAPLPVKGIQVEGRIGDASEERQVVFCGAAPREIAELSVREIALLQALEPPKDWTLGPGEQADFLIAFTGPRADLREFSAQVVAVQAPLRRGGAPRAALPG